MKFNTDPTSFAESSPKTRRFIETEERLKAVEEVALKYGIQIKTLKNPGERHELNAKQFFTVKDNERLIELSYSGENLHDFWKDVDSISPPPRGNAHRAFDSYLNSEDYKTVANFTVENVQLPNTPGY